MGAPADSAPVIHPRQPPLLLCFSRRTHGHVAISEGYLKQLYTTVPPFAFSNAIHRSLSSSAVRPSSALQACAKKDNACLEGQSSAAYLLKRWDEDDNGSLSYKELEK